MGPRTRDASWSAKRAVTRTRERAVDDVMGHPETWAGALLDTVGGIVGRPVAYADRPEALDSTYGHHAYAFRLANDGHLRGWEHALVVRVEPGRDSTGGSIAREAAALTTCAHHGFAVPSLLAAVPDADNPLGRPMLITTRPPGVGILELIGNALDRTNQILGRFGATHAALHALPMDSLWAAASVPALVVERELDAIEGATFADERSWLARNEPAATARVLCHGGWQPLVVDGQIDTLDGGVLSARNWSSAVTADPAFDVAFTLVAFWLAPYYADNRSGRRAMEMLRNMITNIYRGGYEAVAPVDRDRVRYWQAFHALRAAALASGRLHEDVSVLVAGDPLPHEVEAAARKLFWKLAR